MKIVIKILLGLVIFIGAVAYFAPASLIEKYLPNNISVAGMSGTVLKGNVQNLVIDKIGLQNTKWKTSPLSLLSGKVKTNVTLDSSNIKGDFETTYAGSDVHTNDIDLDGDLSLLSPYFERYGLTINGQFDAKFSTLHIKNGIPHNADGVLTTTNTSVLGVLPLNLGNVSSEFSPSDNGFQIYLKNQDGDLDLNGIINVAEGGVYNADLTLSKNSKTPDNVLQTVQLIGKKIDEDSARLIYKGRLSI